jgi:hypothetical protein
MAGKRAGRRVAWVLLLALLMPGTAAAGPFLGEWDWCWHEAHDCLRGSYHWLHYWAPQLYRVRACVHPSNLDQYAPGPSPPVLPTYLFDKYRCRTTPPAPSPPYADPTAYYGRPIAPE